MHCNKNFESTQGPLLDDVRDGEQGLACDDGGSYVQDHDHVAPVQLHVSLSQWIDGRPRVDGFELVHENEKRAGISAFPLRLYLSVQRSHASCEGYRARCTLATRRIHAGDLIIGS